MREWKWWQWLIGIVRRIPGMPKGVVVVGEEGAKRGWWPNKKV